MIDTLLTLAAKPAPHTPGTHRMWTDPHISRCLLETHLNPETDLASRRPETIDRTIRWIETFSGGKPLSILDLGCGPGLYTLRLAKRGHRVTGIDFSKRSIDHARMCAEHAGLFAEYRHQDYLTLSDESAYDRVMMIFTDFCVLSPDERQVLLANILRALKPGGMLVLDAVNGRYLSHLEESRNWEVCETGFWRKGPHLVFSRIDLYAEEGLSLSQHIVLEPEKDPAVYRFWMQSFSSEQMLRQLSAAGFTEISAHENVIPDSPLYAGEDITFYRCRKPAAMTR